MARSSVGRIGLSGNLKVLGPDQLTDVEQRTQWRAACRWHRWYAPWRTSRHQAAVEQRDHDLVCVPERERWSEAVSERWRVLQPLLRSFDGDLVALTLAPKDLRYLSEDKQLAVLDGMLAVASR